MRGYFPFTRALIIFSLSLIFSFAVKGQTDVEEYIPTRKVDKKVKEDTKKNRPKRDKVMYIYKRRTNRTLYGNPCALEVTRKMGFEYLAQEKSTIDLKSYWGRFFHNLWTKTKLVARRGPWWKLTVNKRLKECQQKTGDRTG